MEQFIGLDVSQRTTHLCVIASDGKPFWQGQCLSTPEAIAATIKARAANVVRIGLESGPLSTWHWHALNAMGLPVVCLDANKDCVITAAELQSNTLVGSLLSPDVASTGNGKPDAVSFGINATAVGGVFTVPGE